MNYTINYTFINKNYLQPIISYHDNYNSLLNNIYQNTVNQNNNYCLNIYGLISNIDSSINSIIYSDGQKLFKKNNNLVEEICNYIQLFIHFNSIKYINNNINFEEFNNKQKSENSSHQIENINITSSNENMTLEFKHKNLTNINISESIQKNNEIYKQEEEKLITNLSEEDLKKKKLIESCEEVFSTYQKELFKIKKLESDIKIFDNKLIKLKKNYKDKIIENIGKVQNDYQTWKQIKYIIKNKNDLIEDISLLELSSLPIPILFQSKFNYINDLQNDINSKIILEKINGLDIQNFYINEIEIDNELEIFSTKYSKIIKDIHYNFTHDWDYLNENDDVNSNNNSVLR